MRNMGRMIILRHIEWIRGGAVSGDPDPDHYRRGSCHHPHDPSTTDASVGIISGATKPADFDEAGRCHRGYASLSIAGDVITSSSV